MKTTSTLSGIVVAVLLACLQAAPDDKKAGVLLQAAMAKETVQGDLKGAMDLYRKALKEAGANRQLAAKALLHLAQCYEKQGDAEARKLYERVVREFGDQKDLTETARVRLAALERAGGLSYPSGVTLRKVWEGSGWLEGSPSPDGRYFSFPDWETGDLAVRDLVTGQNRRLTDKGTWKDSDEYAESSVISGDGRQIAYAWRNKERYFELRVMGMDGSNPRVVFRQKEVDFYIEPFQWTADGKQILVACESIKNEGQIALIPVAGGPVRVLKTQAHRVWRSSLSPDGRFLVYDGHERADGREKDIFLLSVEGGQEVPLVRQPGHDNAPVWMPDGKRVLFVSNRTGTHGFWAIDVVEGRPRGIPQLLKDGVGRTVRPNGFTRQGAFYYSANTSIADVYVTEVDPAEGKMLREPAPATAQLVGANSAPSWSPDGSRLAYYSRRRPNEAPRLVIVSVETGEAREVPVKLDLMHLPLIWLPDGKSVIMAAYEGSKRDRLTDYRVDLQTGVHHFVRSFPLPVPGAGTISSDGKTHFEFLKGGEPKLGLGVIACDLETGQEREIARVTDLAEGGFPSLSVSPDSKYLALRLPVEGNQWTAIRLALATGGTWRELYRFPKSETDGSWQLPWTPDGRNLLIVRRTGKDGIPELWRIPIAGGEPQRTGLSMEGMGLFSLHPDGRRIAFECGRPNPPQNELWVLENLPGSAESKAVAGAK
jgi:Tol biopolymer transport system component